MLTQSKFHRLSDPIGTCGDRVYCLCSQNGLFTESWGGHVPREMLGVWNHPIKLLDGFWFGLQEGATEGATDGPTWLLEADAVHAHGAYTAFDYTCGAVRIERRDFVPDGIEGMRITLHFETDDPGLRARGVTLAAFFRSDLRPAWLGAEAGMTDTPDTVTFGQPGAIGQCVFRDTANPWTCVVSASATPARHESGVELWGPQRTHGAGITAALYYSVVFDAAGQAVVTFYVAGSAQSDAAALATAQTLRDSGDAQFARKCALIERTVHTSRVITPDARLNDAMDWSKIVTQMLVRDVPGTGGGVTAGFPVYPWWFGIDSAYAVLPMLQSGQFELTQEILRLLMRQSVRTNPDEPGRVVHELTTTGIVYNIGNLVETPAFIRAVHQTVLWTGDRAFLRECYAFCKNALLAYVLGRNDPDGDLCPSGRSIIETVEMHADFEVIDVASYTYEALNCLAGMARVMGDDDIIPDLHAKAAQLAQRIRDEWWLPAEGLFADVRATPAEVRRKMNSLQQIVKEQHWLLEQQTQIDQALRLFSSEQTRHAAVPADVDAHWLLRHWVVMCPLESGIATPDQAAATLKRLGSPEFCNAWGMYLHPDRHDVMSINTGLLALSAARYGHNGLALDLMGGMTRAFSHRTPGAVSEALPGEWCFYQLWSNLGLVTPTVECLLGIQPDAIARRIQVTPNLPESWHVARVEQLRVGDAAFDIAITRDGGWLDITLEGSAGYTAVLGVVLPVNSRIREAILDDLPAALSHEPCCAGARMSVETTTSAKRVLRLKIEYGASQ